MNRLIQFGKSIALSLIVLLLACLAQEAQAGTKGGSKKAPVRAILLQPCYTATGTGALTSLVRSFVFGDTADGCNALHKNTTGGYNTAVGDNALYTNQSGSYNTAVGASALYSYTGSNNTATGFGALQNNTADDNTANGFDALHNNNIGVENTATGSLALADNTSGTLNTATGYGALASNTSGYQNTATGAGALGNNNTGKNNTANGCVALSVNQGSGNTAVGSGAMMFNTSGGNNTVVGDNAGNGTATVSNVIIIGAEVFGAEVNNSCFIGQIRGVQTVNNDAIPVVIDHNNQLGTVSSSQRFKHDIKPMDKISEAILALKPVTFHYKSDNTNRPEFGLVAEEVAEVNPDLVVRDNKGEIYTVRYDAVNAMLLNEFLKEHKTVEEQGATIARQQKQIEALTAGLQRVSAQVEVSKPAPQTVLNSQ